LTTGKKFYEIYLRREKSEIVDIGLSAKSSTLINGNSTTMSEVETE